MNCIELLMNIDVMDILEGIKELKKGQKPDIGNVVLSCSGKRNDG